jgi:hypothetical protein
MTAQPPRLGLCVLPAVVVLAALCGCGGSGRVEGDREKEQPLSAADEQQVQEFLEAARRRTAVLAEVVAALKTVVDRESMGTAYKTIDKLRAREAATIQETRRAAAGLSAAAERRAQQDPVAEKLVRLGQQWKHEVERIQGLRLPDSDIFFKALGPSAGGTQSP